MALFFNVDVLEQESNGSATLLVAMLKNHWTPTPINKYNFKTFSKKSLAGKSFILNPRDLFGDKTTDILYKVQYIRLAAKRDYLLYKQYKYKGLQTSYFPDLAIDNIKHNPLLIISPTQILFKYEEST